MPHHHYIAPKEDEYLINTTLVTSTVRLPAEAKKPRGNHSSTLNISALKRVTEKASYFRLRHEIGFSSSTSPCKWKNVLHQKMISLLSW